MARSVSGQFVITAPAAPSPWREQPEIKTNATLVVLDAPLLSVSAERIRQALNRLLGERPSAPWQGQIYVALHPAVWTNEDVTVLARAGDHSWKYLVQMPDVVNATRYMRGLTGVLLMELANREAPLEGQAVAIPPWLTEGIANQLAQDELAEVVITSPTRPLNAPQPPRLVMGDHDLDPLAGTRQVLRRHPALTWDQLAWPGVGQLTGADDGLYEASAQLLTDQLLKLPDGPACLRRMLAILPHYQNWQTAFYTAFHAHFARPLDMEKWWSLQVLAFVAQNPGPAWTPEFSRQRLNSLLQVAVAIRTATNALPTHTQIMLQAVVTDFTPAHQAEVLSPKLRELRLAELHMAPRYIALTDAYCRLLAAYLGEPLEKAPPVRNVVAHKNSANNTRLSAREFIRRLNALDLQRRKLAK